MVTSVTWYVASCWTIGPAGNGLWTAPLGSVISIEYGCRSSTRSGFMRSWGWNVAPKSAAPITAASSALMFFASLSSGMPAARSAACTDGTRLEPPESTTVSIELSERPVRLSSSLIGDAKLSSRPSARRRSSNSLRWIFTWRSRSFITLSIFAAAAALAESTCFTRFASRRRRAMARSLPNTLAPASTSLFSASNARAMWSRRRISSSRPPTLRSHAASSTRMTFTSRGVLIALIESAATRSVRSSTSAARTAPEPAS